MRVMREEAIVMVVIGVVVAVVGVAAVVVVREVRVFGCLEVVLHRTVLSILSRRRSCVDCCND